MRIARTHNRLVLSMLAALLAALLGLAFASGLLSASKTRRQEIFIVGALAIGVLEAYGIYRVIKYDDELCRRLGFVCPHCGKPLYEARSFINLRGACPKCKRSILD